MKDGGKYAFLGMESREAGDAVINALNQQVHRKKYQDFLNDQTTTETFIYCDPFTALSYHKAFRR